MSTFLNNFDFEKSSKWDPKIPKLFLHHLGSKCPIVYLLLVGRLLLYANGKQNEMSFWCHKTSLLVWPKLFLYEIEHLVSFYYIFIKKSLNYVLFNFQCIYIIHYVHYSITCLQKFSKKSVWIPILILFLSYYNNKSWKFQIQLEINSSKIWRTNILHWKVLFNY